jgi:putative nucleotidyltransferase with HDIG domain
MKHREEILAQVTQVPSIPAAAAEAAKTLGDPNADLNRIVRVLEHDPGLTSNVLRLANSAFYAGPRSIGTLREAAMRLGTQKLTQVVMASATAPIAWHEVKGYDLPPGELLSHSIAVAVCTQELATELGVDTPPCAFTAGLLHDLGKLLLGTFVAVDAKPIRELASSRNMTFVEAEREILGIDHAEAGAHLLAQWHLPEPICAAVRRHHEPEKATEDRATVDLVHLADDLSVLVGFGGGQDGLNYRASRETVERYKLNRDRAQKAVCSTLIRMRELQTVFAQLQGR